MNELHSPQMGDTVIRMIMILPAHRESGRLEYCNVKLCPILSPSLSCHINVDSSHEESEIIVSISV